MNSQADYTDLKTELNDLKVRVKDVVKKLDTLSCEDKEETMPYINSFSNVVKELSDKIDGLEKICKTNYNSYSGKWEFPHERVTSPQADVLDDVTDKVLEDANPT